MTEEERNLDFLVADLRQENAELRRRLGVWDDANEALKTAMQQILFAKTLLNIQPPEVRTHDDKDSY